LVCRKTKYILQNSTPKIKQLNIQLVINQLFKKKLKIETQTNSALKDLIDEHMKASQMDIYSWMSTTVGAAYTDDDDSFRCHAPPSSRKVGNNYPPIMSAHNVIEIIH
jgi:hypothetical protein